MLIALNNENQRVSAMNAKSHQNYYCPQCHEQLILRHGVKVTPHFAHKHINNQSCHKNESYEHYKLKMLLAQKFIELGCHVDIEPYCSEIQQYPDLVISYTNAVEIQCSKISVKQISERTLGLKKLGLNVHWLIKDVRQRGNFIELTQFESSFINPICRTLLTWDFKTSKLILYKRVQHIYGKKFLGTKQTISLENFFDLYNDELVQMYKIPKRQIYNYIYYCRRRNSVLQPTLSAMYQLQMYDEDVTKYVGFIFPNQIYIETHPVEWQLQYLLIRRTHDKYQSCQLLQSKIKFRYFACHMYDQIEILKGLLNEFEKICVKSCLSVQNEY